MPGSAVVTALSRCASHSPRGLTLPELTRTVACGRRFSNRRRRSFRPSRRAVQTAFLSTFLSTAGPESFVPPRSPSSGPVPSSASASSRSSMPLRKESRRPRVMVCSGSGSTLHQRSSARSAGAPFHTAVQSCSRQGLGGYGASGFSTETSNRRLSSGNGNTSVPMGTSLLNATTTWLLARGKSVLVSQVSTLLPGGVPVSRSSRRKSVRGSGSL